MLNKIIKKKFNRKNIILVMIFLIISLFLNFKFKPVIKSISMNNAKMLSVNAINEAVLEELSQNKPVYEQLLKTEKLETGELTAIFSDMEKINKLKSKVCLSIQNKFLEFKEKKIRVPIGTLTGIELISGLGPSIPMKIYITGNVLTEFKSCFRSEGINQTIYQIYLFIETKIGVYIPGCSNYDNISTNILIAETVILGNVPKVYSSGPVPTVTSLDENLKVKSK